MSESGDWRLFSRSPDGLKEVHALYLDDGQEVYRTTYYAAADPIFEWNEEDFSASIHKRWDDGQVAARVPMAIWAREIAPRQADGNDASLKRWLNDSDNAAFRTFRGSI
jgi:hypothetical protein